MRKIDQLLSKAIERRDLVEIQEALKNGANVNATEPNHETFLMLACKPPCDIKIVEILIQRDRKLLNKEGAAMTPLAMAAYYGNLELAQYLLTEGAVVNQKMKYGDKRTALHWAVLSKEKSSIKRGMYDLLIQNQADPNLKDEFDQTPLELEEERYSSSNYTEDQNTLRYLIHKSNILAGSANTSHTEAVLSRPEISTKRRKK